MQNPHRAARRVMREMLPSRPHPTPKCLATPLPDKKYEQLKGWCKCMLTLLKDQIRNPPEAKLVVTRVIVWCSLMRNMRVVLRKYLLFVTIF